jgi:hypothetical protein
MTMERAFVNREEGFACCCWSADSREALESLFRTAGTSFEKMIEVEEMTG